MVDSGDHALQVKWLWAMAAWYDNLQMTLTGLVRVLHPPGLPQTHVVSKQDLTCAARFVHVRSSGPGVSGCLDAQCAGPL
jgi:hypothetical protein